MAVCQLIIMLLIHRFREQARSHMCPVVISDQGAAGNKNRAITGK